MDQPEGPPEDPEAFRQWVTTEAGLAWLGNLTYEDLQRLKREEDRKFEESKRRVIEHVKRKLRGD